MLAAKNIGSMKHKDIKYRDKANLKKLFVVILACEVEMCAQCYKVISLVMTPEHLFDWLVQQALCYTNTVI